MPIPPAVLRILQAGGAWASAPGALKQEPEDATPPIVRADGYPAAFSSTLNPEQETIQGQWNKYDSATIDSYTSGVPFWDSGIDYTITGDDVPITNDGGVLYSAVVTNGPTTSNALQPSLDTAGTTWSRVSGTQAPPSAPAQPTATSPAPGTLDVQWNCPLDGGAVITGFELDYRNAGTSWATAQTVNTTVPFAQLTGLTNGTALEFRVRATNSIGTSGYSPTGTGTPTATVPGGGSTLALTARGTDGSATLDWIEPDDGGSSIIRYEVQWKSGSQAFSSSRQASVTTETYTRSLTNGTTYDFRVRAVNSAGNSTWSNEARATPAPGEFSRTTAGSETFVWPWDTDAARVIMRGGGGGGGSSTPIVIVSNSNSGSDGQQSSAGSVSASGGGGGPANSNPSSHLFDPGNGYDPRITDGNGGDGGNASTSRGGLAGRPGLCVEGTLTGLVVGDAIAVTVGSGGAGGPSAGTGSLAGSAGTAGSVRIVPLY